MIVWPRMVWSDDGAQLLVDAVRRATPEQLRALADAWKATDNSWHDAVFTAGVVDALDFWTHFSGKEDRVGMMDLFRELPEMIGSDSAQALIFYLSSIDNALWVGADMNAIPDPWLGAGLPGLHDKLSEVVQRYDRAISDSSGGSSERGDS